MPKAISVQTIKPMPGLTRKEPPPPSSAAMMRALVIGLEEERDEAEDEGVEDDRLGEREAQPLDRRDLVAHLGLTRHRLDDLAEDVADTDAGADGPEPGADTERERLRAAAALRDDIDCCSRDAHGFLLVSGLGD